MPTNHYEQIDLDAIQEAEAILSGELPSTPETYAMVAEWYAPSEYVKAGMDYAHQAGRYAKTLESVVQAQEEFLRLTDGSEETSSVASGTVAVLAG